MMSTDVVLVLVGNFYNIMQVVARNIRLVCCIV